jgi:hypothetical protein
MDSSEAVVEKLLVHMGFSQVIYEPDGNVPPDFLADGRIAVEVRRLNQNHDSGNGKRGLEEDAIPLWQKVEKLAMSFGPSTVESWFVTYDFSRPVKPWKILAPKLKDALLEFQSRPIRESGVIFSQDNFELDLFRASVVHQTYFVMGGVDDQQSGGFVVAEMLSNIEHCAAEKSAKIRTYKSRYGEWWLVLTDHIGRGLDDFDKQQLLEHAKRPPEWDRIVIVCPSDPTRWIDF